MTTTVTHVPNPYIHISACPGVAVSRGDALSQIQDYLGQSKTSPHLHPDALFTESGLTYAGSASVGGVILHQLRRVEQGLQGVWLGIDPEADDSLDKLHEIKAELDGVVNGQALGDYQRQLRDLGEGDVSGEIDERNNAVGNIDYEDSTLVTNGRKRTRGEVNGDGDIDAVAQTPIKDREARKKAKKERRKAEQKDRHGQREDQDHDTGSFKVSGSLQSHESVVQIDNSQNDLNGRSRDKNVSDEGYESKPRIQLSASPDQYSSGQTEQLHREPSSSPTPHANGFVTPDEWPRSDNELDTLELNGVFEDDRGAQIDNAEDKAKRKAEKRARKEAKRRRKEEKNQATNAED